MRWLNMRGKTYLVIKSRQNKQSELHSFCISVWRDGWSWRWSVSHLLITITRVRLFSSVSWHLTLIKTKYDATPGVVRLSVLQAWMWGGQNCPQDWLKLLVMKDQSQQRGASQSQIKIMTGYWRKNTHKYLMSYSQVRLLLCKVKIGSETC